jgi:hypothetical protein
VEIGTKVRLCSFNGCDSAPPNCKAQENYWALIGQTGTVLGFDIHLNRYLVQFDCSVQKFGLHCHNPEPDSLYISGVDLVSMQQQK